MLQRKHHSQRGTSTLPATGRLLSPRYLVLGAALIVVVTSVAYFPAMQGGFIFDDDLLLTDNSLIKAPNGIVRFWFTAEAPDYWPMTNTTLWLEWRLWGMNPTGYHVTNLVLHIAAALLIWAILQKLTIPGAFLAALLFAVHPVNVESVAWIAQRKNTLAMLFFLLSILCYLREEEDRERTEAQERRGFVGVGRWYGFSLLAFVLAMLSKGSVAILPLVLLWIVWWQRRRITVRDLARAAPFLLVAAVLVAVNIWFQTHDTDVVVRDVSLAQRLAGAGAVVWFYLSKALVPIDLVFVYPQWHVQIHELLWWLPLAAALLVTAVLGWQRDSQWGRRLLFAWGFFGVALVPVLGFTDVGFMQYSLVADHYQHIALIGVLALAAAAWSAGCDRARAAATAVAVVMVGGLTFLTWQQSQLYGDAVNLYLTTLKENPASSLIHNNLGLVLANTGRSEEAIEHYQQALRLDPHESKAHYNLGLVLVKMGRTQEAIEHYQQALQLQPDYAAARNNLGAALLDPSHMQEAIDQFQQVLRLKPDYAEAYNNLGVALLGTGRIQEAIDQFQQALRLKPTFAEAYGNLGNALANANRTQEAIERYQQALRLKPDYAEAYSNLGAALLKSGRPQEAIEHYQQALRLKPDYLKAHYNLGVALLKTSQPQEALVHFQQALRLKPDFTEAYANLAKAYAQMHRSAEAITAAQKALELARSQGQTALTQQMEAWLDSSRSSQGNLPQEAPRSKGTPSAP